jgi:hypothetical protein
LLLPYISTSLEELQSKYQEDKTSVGMIRIQLIEFYWETVSREWEPEELAIMNQLDLLLRKNLWTKFPIGLN